MKQLGFDKTKQILRKYRIPYEEGMLAKDRKEAEKIAEKNIFPAAMKIISPDIVHKSDIDGVIVGIKNRQELLEGFDKIMDDVKKKRPEAKIEGIQIQRMINGYETIIGMKRDAQFGPAIMFGLGGIMVEILKDVSLRITPINKKEALDMIKGIKTFEILNGARGKAKANIAALADIITKTSKLADNAKEIEEIDFNPVMVDDKKAILVDARLMVKE